MNYNQLRAYFWNEYCNQHPEGYLLCDADTYVREKLIEILSKYETSQNSHHAI